MGKEDQKGKVWTEKTPEELRSEFRIYYKNSFGGSGPKRQKDGTVDTTQTVEGYSIWSQKSDIDEFDQKAEDAGFTIISKVVNYYPYLNLLVPPQKHVMYWLQSPDRYTPNE